MAERHLVIMLKEPVAGRVKTRLGRDIGMTVAAWWFRRQARALVRRLSGDPRWRTILAVAPDAAGMRSRFWPARVARIPQGPGDLGQRMRRIFKGLPPGAVVIIGADVPGVTPAKVWDAFRALGRAPAVVGPATDGGYWLIGLRRVRAVSPRLLSDVRWSGPHALADTLRTLPAPVATVATLSDVDTTRDLQRLSCRGGHAGPS